MAEGEVVGSGGDGVARLVILSTPCLSSPLPPGGLIYKEEHVYKKLITGQGLSCTKLSKRHTSSIPLKE